MLDGRDIRMFDYFTRFAQPFRESIRAHAERVAAEEGVEVEYIKRPKGYRKEDRIREIAPVAGMTAASVANPLAIAAIVAGSAVAKWTKQATTTQAIPLSKSTSLNLRSRVFR